MLKSLGPRFRWSATTGYYLPALAGWRSIRTLSYFCGEATPNDQSVEVYNDLVGKIDAQLMKLSQIVKTDVPAFNQVVKDQNIPAIVAKPRSP